MIADLDYDQLSNEYKAPVDILSNYVRFSIKRIVNLLVVRDVLINTIPIRDYRLPNDAELLS